MRRAEGSALLPASVVEAKPVFGGDINSAYRVRLRDGRLAFLKTNGAAPPGSFAREARDLNWLREPNALALPTVLEVGASYLMLEWVEEGRPSREGEEQLGRGLALLHRAGAPHFGDPFSGPEGKGTTGFGSLSLPNDPLPDWPAFYANCRLLPLLRLARERGVITKRGGAAVERICARIEQLTGPPEPPARLHGDLWRGNVLFDRDGQPWLIDPAAYGGHREVDLAMLALFGGLPERSYAAYAECYPLAEAWQERIALYQLAPLLVHAVLFGGSYGQSAEAVALRYA